MREEKRKQTAEGKTLRNMQRPGRGGGGLTKEIEKQQLLQETGGGSGASKRPRKGRLTTVHRFVVCCMKGIW